jgi:hypothetical protein
MDTRDLERALDSYANIDPPYPCWLGGDNVDAGELYCRPCAEKVVADGKAEFVDGGYAHQTEDCCAHCHTCGQVLDYFLTEAGVGYELDHFSSVRFRSPLSRDDAFHVARVVEAAPDDPAAVRLAKRAVAKIPSTHP